MRLSDASVLGPDCCESLTEPRQRANLIADGWYVLQIVGVVKTARMGKRATQVSRSACRRRHAVGVASVFVFEAAIWWPRVTDRHES